MRSVNRYEELKDESFDIIIAKIKNGSIKSGRYAGLVKIKKDFKIRKELFNDGSKDNKSERE